MSEQPFAQIDDGVIRFDWTLESAPEKVWPALVVAERVGRWMDCPTVLEPTVGGRVSFDWGADGAAEGRVTDVREGRALKYTWGGAGWPEESRVRWEIEPSGTGTRLRLEHRDLTGPEPRVRELAAGWHDFLDGLLAELGEREHPKRHDELVASYAAG